MTDSDDFIQDAVEAHGVAAIHPAGVPPVIIVVVDDSEDDELVSIIARASKVPAEDFTGGWDGSPRDGARFTLQRLSGGFQRRWLLPGINHDLVACAQEPHYVAVLPAEIAGDLSGFADINRLGGAIIVAAEATDALRIAHG